jgi:hypothetical protein
LSLEKKEPHPFVHFTVAMEKIEEARTRNTPVISSKSSEVNLDHLNFISKIAEGKEIKEKKDGKGWDVKGLVKF